MMMITASPNSDVFSLSTNCWQRVELGHDKTRPSYSWSDISSMIPLSLRKKLGRRNKSRASHLTAQHGATTNRPHLVSLPPELLSLIISHLDVVNQVCLQSTCHFFHHFIQIDRSSLATDRCRKWAITCFMEQDMKRYPAKIACAFCKTVRKTACFQDVDASLYHRLWDRRGFRSMQMTREIPFARYCANHRASFFRGPAGSGHLGEKTATPVEVDPFPMARWATFQVLRCFHCARCVRDNDTRGAGCAQCMCNVCPRLITQHSLRFGRRWMWEGRYMWDGPEMVNWRPAGGQPQLVRVVKHSTSRQRTVPMTKPYWTADGTCWV